MNYGVYFTLSTFLYVAILASAKPLQKPRISLSPSTWDAEIFRRLETISLRKNPRPKPLVFTKKQGLVSGTTSVLAVHAGTQALRNGGNAMDACLTTAMAEVSLTAGSKVSFAGVTNILYYDHVTKRTHNLDAGWKIPKYRNVGEGPTMETLGDSVLVPGFIAGMHEAAEFAKFPLSSLLEPALYFAEKGIKMPHELSKMIQGYYEETLLKTEEGKAIFTNPDTKSPYKPGELFQQPQLAHFIQNLQKHGKNYMYKGNWARQFINTLRNHGGKITSRDLSRYEPQWLEPASTTYSGYHVTTTGSKWGGVELIEMLQLLKEAGVGSANDSYLTNSSTLHALMSISEYSQFISDYLNIKREGVGTIKEFFQVDATVKGRLSNRSADTIWGHLSNSEGVEMIKQSFTELLSELPNFDKHRELKRGSSGIVAIDNQGNICAMAHTANSNPWGTGLFVEGVALPHSGAVFQDILGSLRPGSHIPSGQQPVIIFREKLKEEKKVVIAKEKVEKPVRVTDAPTTGSTKRELGPIGPRGIWESTDHMTRVTEQKRHLTPTKEIPRIERKIADHRITAKGHNRPPTRYPRDEKDSGVLATENVKVFSVAENPLKRKLNRASSSVKIARPTAERTEKPQFEMGPLLGPRGVWGSPGRLITVPKHLQTTASSTVMRRTADLTQRFVLTKSRLPRTGLQRLAVFSARGRNSFNLRPELRRHWNNEIGEEVQEKVGKEHLDEGVENKENRVEERGFESVEEEEERDGLEEELVVKEEDGEDGNEPLSIGGLYTENDLDTIVPPPFTPIRGHYRILNKSRQNWFRNFVREIFRRQQKRHKLWKKIYQRKRTTRTRWSKPFAALSVIGQSAPEALLQYINNLIDNKMDAKQASDTPMFFSSIPGSRRQTLRLERFIFSNDVISEVRSRGTDVKEVHNKEGRVISGEGAVISVTDRQERYGCSHPDSEGYAESL